MALPKMELPVGKERKGPIPDMDSIHRWVELSLPEIETVCFTETHQLYRALFNKKSAPGKKQTFTITMPKKSKDEQERW